MWAFFVINNERRAGGDKYDGPLHLPKEKKKKQEDHLKKEAFLVWIFSSLRRLALNAVCVCIYMLPLSIYLSSLI